MTPTACYPPKSSRDLERWMDRVTERRGGLRFSYISVSPASPGVPVIALRDDDLLYCRVTPAAWNVILCAGRVPKDFVPRMVNWHGLPVVYAPGYGPEAT